MACSILSLVVAICPVNFDAVGDVCFRLSSNEVTTSQACIAECGDDMPAEIHSVAERDNAIAYANPVYLGKYSLIIFFC